MVENNTMPDYVEKAKNTFDEEDEYWGEAFVVVGCTNCETWNLLQPRVGGDSIRYNNGGEGQLNYKKGGTDCRCCGMRINPILSIRFG